ncbi:MAG: hypothetical protein N3I35_15470 [Clostridia bacterium]|nr:hypothetical protein [Clostridia bacterium]
MDTIKQIICPLCNNTSFVVRYEATYVYSYYIDSDAPGIKNSHEFLPFMFDNREQKDSRQYIECISCKAIYPCYFNEWNSGIGQVDLQKAISPSNAVHPGLNTQAH